MIHSVNTTYDFAEVLSKASIFYALMNSDMVITKQAQLYDIHIGVNRTLFIKKFKLLYTEEID